MGYFTFFILAFLALLGYYVWAIFIYKPNKPIQLDEVENEVVEFLFDAPIKVSEQFFRPKQVNKDPSSVSQDVNQQEGKNQSGFPEENSENEKNRSHLSQAAPIETKAPNSVQKAEVEYNHFYKIDLSLSMEEGRGMFAHIPLSY